MPTVLIVDDDGVDREMAARCLKVLPDLQILMAEDGTQALDVIGRQCPDLVLTDLRMPRMDGLELVDRLRDDHPLLPVVLMTGKGSELIAVQALKAGAASYVPKSELTSSLVDTIEMVLEIAETNRTQHGILRYFKHHETRFELPNDLDLIYPVTAYFQASLDRQGVCGERVRTQVSVALAEGLSNAMIHGNLEIPGALRITDRKTFERLMEQRVQESLYADRRVLLTARETLDKVEYTVADEGTGFDPAALPDPTAPENILNVTGRGILLMRTFMDRVEFNPEGNQVTLTKLFEPEST